MTGPKKAGHPEASPAPSIEGVLFDMDGVITDTATAHAEAWKRLFDEYLRQRATQNGQEFIPFDADSDYRRHVDGMPRYDGVERFLRSRGIEIPHGDPEDAPDRETVCGLGNRKNHYFRAWLAEHRVRTYPTTVALIERLRACGIKVAVFSASRNCEAVLRNAGVHDLFDARVDGMDLQRLDLPGKPDPAMLAEAAARLGVPAERTAVIEDSAAGVRAGRRGGFRPVVGVNRGDYAPLLAEAGADIVVADLGELELDCCNRLAIRRLDAIPSAWDRCSELLARLEGRAPALFLDYDGTLTPIVPNPKDAVLADATRAVLADLAQRWPVAVISGRALTDLRARVGLGQLVYAGSHGFEMQGPGFRENAANAERYLPALDAAERELSRRLAGIDGHIVERKPFAVAVHYRLVADAEIADVEAIVDGVLSGLPGLYKSHGKKVFQIRPDLDWHKGRAVLRLIAALGLEATAAVPVYIGDDLTDEDVFRVLSGRGIGIAIRDDARGTSAAYALADPADVRRFLEWLRDHVGMPR